MSRKVSLPFLLAVFSLLLTACRPTPPAPDAQAGLPNPASVYCEQNGGKLEFRLDKSGGTYGVCRFPDGSQCEEWAYYRGECSPAGQAPAPTVLSTAAPANTVETSPEPTATANPQGWPTPLPIDPAGYQGWWTFTNEAYGFSLQLPTDWAVLERTQADPLLNEHLLTLQPHEDIDNLSIRLTFRRAGEEVPLWPTGVGAGEFIQQGSLDIAGEEAQRWLFVCPTGQVNSVWYHQGEGQPNLPRGGLEFGVILSYTGVYCQAGYSLEGKALRNAEMIIASLDVE